MPANFWTEAMRMGGSGLAVGIAAAPFGLAGWFLARRRHEPLLPALQSFRVPWTGFEVLAAFLVISVVVPVVVLSALSRTSFFPWVYGPAFPASAPISNPSFEAEAAMIGGAAALVQRDHFEEQMAIRAIWIGMIALPLQLALLVLFRRTIYSAWKPRSFFTALPARVALAFSVWAVLTPTVLLVHAALNVLFTYFDLMPQEHPLSKLSASRPEFDRVLFLLQVCQATPLIEEILFRGVLLGWLFGGQSLFDRENRSLSHPPGDRRIWLVMGVGLAMAISTSWPAFGGPIGFAGILAAGWLLLRFAIPRHRRTFGAVYASAAFFAIVHSGVWPTPIPLFVLGLGLGWLAVRTRGVLAPTIVHGLFNAVSAVFVLRGG